MTKITAKEIAKSEGVSVDAIRARWNNVFREIEFDRNAELSPDQIAAISRKKPAKKQPKKSQTVSTPREAEAGIKAPAPSRPTDDTAKPSRWYYLADAIFFSVVAVTGYELWFFLGRWGIMFWCIYAAATTISLVMAKDASIPKTAAWGFTAVVIFEALAYFGHLAMANLLICNAAKTGQMPFFYNGYFRESLEYPFWIAVILAGILSGVVIYVVWLRLEITKEVNVKTIKQ